MCCLWKKMGSFCSGSGRAISSLSWKSAISSGLCFALRPKRFLPFFAIDTAGLIVFLSLVSANPGLVDFLLYGTSSPDAGIVQSLSLGIGAFIVWLVAGIFILGALIRQSAKPAEYGESWRVSLRSLHSLVIASVIVSLLTVIVSMVPYLGVIFTVMVGLAFLFVNQFIILEGKGFYRAMMGSLRTFGKKPGRVFIAWILSAVVSMLLIMLLASPMVALLIYGAFTAADEAALVELFTGPLAFLSDLFVVLFVLGVSVSKTFSAFFLTSVYMQLKKKKWLFF